MSRLIRMHIDSYMEKEEQKNLKYLRAYADQKRLQVIGFGNSTQIQIITKTTPGKMPMLKNKRCTIVTKDSSIFIVRFSLRTSRKQGEPILKKRLKLKSSRR